MLERLNTFLGKLPTTPIVILTGVALAFLTAFRYLLDGIAFGCTVKTLVELKCASWTPDGDWLLFVAGVIGFNFAIKRATYKPSPPAAPDVENATAIEQEIR
jgi:hypothetical protein